jgi:hypothetical protein
MHTGPVPESFVDDWRKLEDGIGCRRCGGRTVECRTWESDCGGYVDHKFRCTACGVSWWIEGPDA